MKPSYSTLSRRPCCERHGPENNPVDRAVVGPTARETAHGESFPGRTGTAARTGHSVRGWRTEGGEITPGCESSALLGGRLGPPRLSHPHTTPCAGLPVRAAAA